MIKLKKVMRSDMIEVSLQRLYIMDRDVKRSKRHLIE